MLGEPVWGNRALMRRIGYCPEHEGTYDDLTGLEMVAGADRAARLFPRRGDARARAEKMLGVVDLKDAMHRRLGEYSKGMRQRAKLAQAMAHDPEVRVSRRAAHRLRSAGARAHARGHRGAGASKGACIVVSSHVLHEIETMTSQILLIHKGQLRAEGDVHRSRALIDAHPHKVRVECDKPRALAEKLVAQEHVVAVTVETDGIIVDTRMPDRLYPAIPEAANAAGVYIRALTSPDDNMAAVFKYLTETSS